MTTLHIAGVPEHFNYPWLLAIEEGAFAAQGIDLLWQDVPEGSGRMGDMLRNGETDVAIMLTEAVIKSSCEGNPIRIVQEYVGSPLLWGIHVDAASPFQKRDELEGKKAAISRPGSGSHLMAFLHARDQGWNTPTLAFEVVHTLDGAIQALAQGSADYFLWEHFTTKPLVDKGIFRRLGDYPTPWPCFVIAAKTAFIHEQAELLTKLLETINRYTTAIHTLQGIDRTLANSYAQQVPDIREWLGRTQWSQKLISTQVIDQVIDSLYSLKLIDKRIPATQVLPA